MRPKELSIVSDESWFCEMCEEISDENIIRAYLVRSGFINIVRDEKGNTNCFFFNCITDLKNELLHWDTQIQWTVS
jgi:hypothetical protein